MIYFAGTERISALSSLSKSAISERSELHWCYCKISNEPGTLDLLKSKALINDTADEIIAIFGNDLPRHVENVNKWTTRDYILFKTESYKISATEKIPKVNIALGNSESLAEFNKNILFFEIVK